MINPDGQPWAGWAALAEPLADWAMTRMVVRKDAYGAYTAAGSQYTAHEPLTHDLLVGHFRGKGTLGAHIISPDGRCLRVVADVDAHDANADPDLNWNRNSEGNGL